MVSKEGSEDSALVASAASSTEVPPGEPSVEQMTAVILQSFGGLKNIKVGKRSVPNPAPAENMINVKVTMSGINFQDVMTRLGVMDAPVTPFVLGSECVGVVTAVGEGVTTVKPDDTVFCLPENGAWAEQVTVPSNLAWRCDKRVPPEKLACTLPYLVADFLIGDSCLTPESSVLIHSAGGSVGLAFKDLAKDANVIGIASKWKFEKLEGLGFKNLIERGTDYVSEVRKLQPNGVDFVFDSQGGEDCARGISILAPGGKYFLYGSANIVTGETKSFFTLAKSWWQVEKISPLKLYEENKTVGGLSLRQFLKTDTKIVKKKLEKIWKLMAEGKIQPIVDSTLNFKEVTDGMAKLHERKNIGKILLNFDMAAAEETG